MKKKKKKLKKIKTGNPFKTTKFKSLQAKWYNRLKKDGFEDIEEFKEGADYLKKWHCNYFQKKYHPLAFTARQHYFELACAFLNDYQFQTDLDREVWEMHCMGGTVRGIAKEFKRSSTFVNQIIIRIRKIMLENERSN